MSGCCKGKPKQEVVAPPEEARCAPPPQLIAATQREPKRLMVACEGRYFGCQPSNEILAFHRRLINSGFVRT
jgi:hypothetical protein